MFTVQVPINSPLTQYYYDDILQKLDVRHMVCSCGKSDCLIYHGSYQRTVVTEVNAEKISITRLKCTQCGRTHAVLLSTIVPYARISMSVQIEVILCCEEERKVEDILQRNELLDRSALNALSRRYYDRWRDAVHRLPESESTSSISALDASASEDERNDAFRELECISFSCHHRQFMQMRNTPNSLLSSP